MAAKKKTSRKKATKKKATPPNPLSAQLDVEKGDLMQGGLYQWKCFLGSKNSRGRIDCGAVHAKNEREARRAALACIRRALF